jgi:hypothetical protein
LAELVPDLVMLMTVRAGRRSRGSVGATPGPASRVSEYALCRNTPVSGTSEHAISLGAIVDRVTVSPI